MSAISSSPALPAAQKPGARVVMFNLDTAITDVLRDCFKQFGVEAVIEPDRTGQRLLREKFEACVVALDDPMAAPAIELARKSPSNRRILVYALASSTLQALSYSKHGINAVIDLPLQRSAALKVVRASHLLVLNELRRYARVPLVTAVTVETESRMFDAVSIEFSAGGMSMRTERSLLMGRTARLAFTLPGSASVQVNATVCWSSAAEQCVGLRFDAMDTRRTAVKAWIEKYLDMV